MELHNQTLDVNVHLIFAQFLSVDLIHAIAVPFDTALHHVIAQAGDARHGHGHLDSMVERPHPPRVYATARTPRHPDPLRIHV